MKGIILAGGKGTRLFPATIGVCKQLIPVYDKPMIYYPLSTLMLAGIRDILIICNPEDLSSFQRLFASGEHLGIKISYAVQEKPNGIAEAFIIGEKFIGSDRVALILGDNIFYGQGWRTTLRELKNVSKKATVFGYPVPNPERYGVIEFDVDGKPKKIVEKPKEPKSNRVVVGLYFYDSSVVDIAKDLSPSARGELEISEINDFYLKSNDLHVHKLGRGFAWLDMGNFQSMSDASIFIRTVEERQGLKIACIEEIAYRNGWMSKEDLQKVARSMIGSGYGKYLLGLMSNENI